MDAPFQEKKYVYLMIFVSVVVQILLGYFFGHYHDIRIFMASGYEVNSGLNPYLYHDLSRVFNNPLFFESVPGIGYPPPWPLLLGILFQLSSIFGNNIFFYNLAIKSPIIIGNISLAYVVKHILIKLNVDRKVVRNSWFFILFNPFLILTTSAWGQFDNIVALFFLMSLVFLNDDRHVESAIFLALSASLKPTTLPLVLIPALYLAKNKLEQKLGYYSAFTITTLLCSVLPFFIFQWNTQTLLINWNVHFQTAGAMSPFNVVEIFGGSFLLPGPLEILGFMWLPSIVLMYFLMYRNPPSDLGGLIKSALYLTFVFFLTRTWVSEQNMNLILPLMVIAVATSINIDSKFLHLTWIIPLIFMFFNTSFHQLFFLVDNNIRSYIAVFDEDYGTLRLTIRFLIVIVWQVLGWKIVLKLIGKPANKKIRLNMRTSK